MTLLTVVTWLLLVLLMLMLMLMLMLLLHFHRLHSPGIPSNPTSSKHSCGLIGIYKSLRCFISSKMYLCVFKSNN